jgi:hypothetical protein
MTQELGYFAKGRFRVAFSVLTPEGSLNGE